MVPKFNSENKDIAGNGINGKQAKCDVRCNSKARMVMTATIMSTIPCQMLFSINRLFLWPKVVPNSLLSHFHETNESC